MAIPPITRNWAGFISTSCFNQRCIPSGETTYGNPSKTKTRPINVINNFIQTHYQKETRVAIPTNILTILGKKKYRKVLLNKEANLFPGNGSKYQQPITSCTMT